MQTALRGTGGQGEDDRVQILLIATFGFTIHTEYRHRFY